MMQLLWRILQIAGWYLLARAVTGKNIATTRPSHINSSSSSSNRVVSETFTEDLVVKPLQDGKTLLHFEFRIEQIFTMDNQELRHHYHLFPRQIGEIALQNNVEELHLSFTQGNWRQGSWGYPPVSSQGVGAEVFAWISGATQEESLDKWKGLTNALSGVFCASLNFIGDDNTSMPQLAFNTSTRGKRSSSSSSSVPGRHGVLRHGFLPRENVCTENLTPWVKQLPCQAKSGLGVLLNPHRLYNMDFHSMGISLAPAVSAADDGQTGLVYKQHVTVVLNPRTFGLDRNWTLGELMDRDVDAACPVATSSTVRVVMPESETRVLPTPMRKETLGGQDTYVYDIQKQNASEIRFEFADSTNKKEAQQRLPLVEAHRHVNGHGGGISGGIETLIINRSNQPVDVTYSDTLPWYLRVYLHTLAIEAVNPDGDIFKQHPTQMIFTPAIDRGRPSTIELAVTLPANTRTTLRYDFDKGFIKYTEHPPDANRGFNIGPAIISYRPDTDSPGIDQPLFCALQSSHPNAYFECKVRVYTELFLASLPTPDFSMPYNVITFTCTVLALFFGRIFNLLTRDFAVLKGSD